MTTPIANEATSDTAHPFIGALQHAERSGDVEPLVELFAEDAELENPARTVTRKGPDGARQFWRQYLSAFGRIRSEFTRVHEGEGFAAMEWRSDGTLPSGEPVSYRGVSLIEVDRGGDSGARGKVRHFRTYYDSATFLPQGSKHAADERAARRD